MMMTVIASLLIASLLTLTKLRNTKVAVLCLTVPAVVPVLWVAFDCANQSTSEACVWGQALLPFYLGAAVFLATPILYLSISAVGKLHSICVRRG